MLITAPRVLPDPIRAAIFDMDGTLLDTEAGHRRAFAEVGRAMGVSVPDELLASMVGVYREGSRRLVADAMGPDFPLDRFFDESDVLFEAMVDAGIPLRPGAELILDHFADAGVPMAIATSTEAPYAAQRLEKAGLLSYFDVVITRSDVRNAKPHPEPYLLAASRLGVDPMDCIAVEDSPAGLRSATAAGIATIVVPDLLPATEEMTLAAARVLPSLSALRDLLLAPVEAR
ncbi:HAD superfamily hydrolase (TIGR01509 family) [Novosphingobium sp. PhB165]|uniref:HAD family hydrolase n=1 Tax=Novosphingobium sp. PhB165 TaxID=2485105 RepID=UPI0010EB7FA1|nr:HAD family phosphatase [Novosphingobium sp. PhB165]TCM17329.1 HAD superfamily hydrolase (TIGR01509 family) [Novosphingobium sp. PhB165]